jgi:acyl-CoA reductase-like NAD-dependent aldehyde dehydrogenase
MFQFNELLGHDTDLIVKLIDEEHGKNVVPNIQSWSEFQLIGILAGIIPFSFAPIATIAPIASIASKWMFLLIIVCGNNFTLKSSERSPSSTMHIAPLLKEVGLPNVEIVVIFINIAEHQWAKIVADWRNPQVSDLFNGFFVGDTLVNNIMSKIDRNKAIIIWSRVASYQCENYG